ncbi:hypothetical protein [Aliiroseovarius subalbicans]|uniref:hypothetical protein n=1 Tax=Aliiroseovarius subalbicans TaxID=2925840 RepID=UPI001F59ADD3|nr:hypothetical protein [Aliiroseovarius subalbicans]MCI2400741.1 hypothetical protein [Aliiroseovarius subalbicans]
MFRTTTAALALVALTAVSAQADDVTDTLNSALTAYEEGDIQYALEELEYAKQLLSEMKTAELTAYLPEAPDGWTREISEDGNAGMSFLGGGIGAEARYSNGDESFDISITADNPMVAAMASMIGNAALMGAKIERVGREKFMNQDGDLTGLVDNRIMIQASGTAVEVMIPVLKTIDYKGLEDFGG